MFVVLLSGGSGQRLWPLSNEMRSKQYIRVIDSGDGLESMVQRVWKQLDRAGLRQNAVITAGKGQTEILRNQLGDVRIAVEPERRDTFAAIALSCAWLKANMGAAEDSVVAVLPVDPYTGDDYFAAVASLEGVLASSRADIALLGAKPTYPSAKYGYIVPEGRDHGVIFVSRFKEKPTEREAEELIARGALWNCGVFCFRLRFIEATLREFGLETDYGTLYREYGRLPKTSFDYAVLEHCNNIVALPMDAPWKDLGTWNTLTEEMSSQSIGPVVMSDSCRDSYAINELEIPMVVIGARNLIVAASADGILVSDRAESSHMKEWVKDIHNRPMYEERRWGWLRVLDITRSKTLATMTRRVFMKAGMNSGQHYHLSRDEAWTFLSGRGRLALGQSVIVVKAGDTLRIPKGTKHALRASEDLEFIEIQSGETLADEDIHHVTFDWVKIIEEILSLEEKP